MIAKSYEVDAFDFKASMKATRNRDEGINGLIDLAFNDPKYCLIKSIDLSGSMSPESIIAILLGTYQSLKY